MTEPIARPIKKKQGKRKSSNVAAHVRELQKMIEAAVARLAEVAREEGEKLTSKAAALVNAEILAEASDLDDNAKIRSVLNTITGGAVERFVRVSTDEEAKSFLREHGWRV